MSNVYPIQIERAAIKLNCSVCGAEASAVCGCGKPYIPNTKQKQEMVASQLKLDPKRSDRQISKDTGVDHKTVAVTRAALELTGEIPQWTAPRTPKRKAKKSETDNELPSEEEAEASHQETLYDQACLFLERMTGETRQRFFAHIKRKYSYEK